MRSGGRSLRPAREPPSEGRRSSHHGKTSYPSRKGIEGTKRHTSSRSTGRRGSASAAGSPARPRRKAVFHEFIPSCDRALVFRTPAPASSAPSVLLSRKPRLTGEWTTARLGLRQVLRWTRVSEQQAGSSPDRRDLVRKSIRRKCGVLRGDEMVCERVANLG